MHRASHRTSIVRNALLASCLLLVGAAASAFAQGPAPSCEITGPTSVQVGEPFSLCGISGDGLTYTWQDADDNVLNHDRCLDFPAGLPAPGSYDFLFTISQGPDFLKCPVTIIVTEPETPDCSIKDTPKCGSTELCGPDGLEYAWSGPGVDGETSQCVTATQNGTYSLMVTTPGTKNTNKCEITIEIKQCGTNCPRTVGYWGQQADQKDNGSTKFTKAQVTAIAECISGKVDVFSGWGTGDAAFDAFDAVINPDRPMTCEKQVKRQLAGLLANICATGMTPSQGGDVSLDGSTVISCGGESMTIDELVEDVDTELAKSEPDFCKYIDCLDNINNGIGIPLDQSCHADELKTDLQQRLGNSPLGAGSLPTELSFSASNPASQASVLRFALPADGRVSMKIFDVAGRQVADLGGGFMPAGSHTMSWDVTGVARGLYFARLAVNGQVRTQQIVVSR